MLSGDDFYGDDATSGLSIGERLEDVRAERASWPAPTEAEPDLEEVQEWEDEGGCEATDGCWVEPDGTCEHGHPSWMLRMGLI